MFRTISLAAAAAFLAMPAFACDGFEVHDAYARVSTAMSTSGAAFMTMQNHGNADCHIVGARADVAAMAQLHTHVIDENGVAHMREVADGFRIPAGGEHVLQRGGDHVMLMGLTHPLAQGDVINITFVFEDGTESTVPVSVGNTRAPGRMGHGTMQSTGQSGN